METAGIKWKSEERREDLEGQMSSQPSTSSAKTTGKKRKKSEKEKGCKPKEEKTQDTEAPGHTRRKVPVPPMPDYLPPVNLIHRDVVRAWCLQKRLSSKGQKLDAYKRLLAGAFPKQMPELKNVPDSAKEARLKTSHKKMKTEPEESKVAVPLEIVTVPEEQIPALIDPPVLYEEVSTTVVTTPASEAVLASWARIASSAKKFEAVPASATSAEGQGEMWCVVHGTSLPGNSKGWVRLQFHAGQAWVPDKKGRAVALFLIPSCTFPPSHLEDNMLCPNCVHRNKVLNKSLEG